MQIHQKTTTLLFSSLAISILALSGCRTGGFTKPDMGKLAFWKPENSLFASKTKDTPPPPARHFDPAPIEGETRVASVDSEVLDIDTNKLQRRFKNDIAEMRKELGEATASMETPLRAPYAIEATDAAQDFVDNGFQATNEMKNQFAATSEQVKSDVTSAQNDFNAAMNNTVSEISNDFQATQKVANDMTQSWKDKLDSPGSSPADNGFAPFAPAKINNTLAGTNSLGGSLAPMQNGSATQPPTTTPLKTAANNLSPLGLKPLKTPAYNDNNSFGGGLSSATPTTQPRSGDGGFGKSMSGTNQQITSIQQDRNSFAVAQPKMPANLVPMKSQPDNSFGAPSSMDAAPPNRVASTNSSYQPSFQPPANLAAKANNQLLPNTQEPQSQTYPSTSHGGFATRGSTGAGNFSPMDSPVSDGQASQVGFQAPASQTAQGRVLPSASKIRNHVADVDIPDSVLKGSSTYAPGSVQKLESVNR